VTGNAHTVALLIRSFQRELDALLAKSQAPIVGTLAVASTEQGYRVDQCLTLSSDAAAQLLTSEPFATH